MSINHNEIGSEFWSVPTAADKNKLFGDGTSWFLSGRAALNAIIRDIKKIKTVKTAALPSYCCDSMIMPFISNGIEVTFYSVCFENGALVQKVDEEKEADIILIMDYFGYVGDYKAPENAIIIRDLTHSVLCDFKKDADYYFGSLRKWAGFLTGGFAYKKDGSAIETAESEKEGEYIALRRAAMEEKAEYISGKSESKSYLERFNEAEELLDCVFEGKGDSDDINSALYLDTKLIKEKRRENAKELLKELSDYAIFKEVKNTDCPLFVPLYIENGKRDSLKKHLIKNSVYCPVHWPVSNYHKLNNDTAGLYENEISIICDQRYNTCDMQRIIKEVKEFLG